MNSGYYSSDSLPNIISFFFVSSIQGIQRYLEWVLFFTLHQKNRLPEIDFTLMSGMVKKYLRKKYHVVMGYSDNMRFCTSCGKELDTGKKFCEYCGAPVEQAAASSQISPPAGVPVMPPAGSEKRSGKPGKNLIIAGIIGVLLIAAGLAYFGLPLISDSQKTGTNLQQPSVLVTDTLIQIPATVSTEPTHLATISQSPATSSTYEDKYTETYVQVYTVDRAFVGGQKEVFSHKTASPPLYIKFNITPEIFYGEKIVDIGLSSERVMNTSYTSPSAGFKVSVYDEGNGELVEEQGFNRQYGIMTKQEFMIRAPGNYRVELTGNDVVAEVRILTGK